MKLPCSSRPSATIWIETRESWNECVRSKIVEWSFFSLSQFKSAKTEKPKTAIKAETVLTPQQNNNTPINKEAKKELQKHQRDFQQLEEKIAILNEQKKKLESSLADPAIYTQKDSFLKAEADYKSATDELVRLNKAYESAFEKIMELESKVTS